MKNRVILVFATLLLFPNVVFAAWWNPFSWFNGWDFLKKDKDHKTEILENRVQELEEKLEKSIATTTEEKSDDSDGAKVPSTLSSPSSTQNKIPTVTPTQISTISVKTEVVTYTDLVKKYQDFQPYLSNIKGGLKKLSPLSAEREFYQYVSETLNSVTADLGYLITIKNFNPPPPNIVEIYLSKFNKLKSGYDNENKKYSVNYEIEWVAYQKQQVVTEQEKNLLQEQERLEYAQDLKVKMAEMDQLKVQINTLAGSSLLGILNAARRLDGNPLFYTYNGSCASCTFNYPYENPSYYDNNTSYLRSGLHAIVDNYKAFLNVELAKNQ